MKTIYITIFISILAFTNILAQQNEIILPLRGFTPRPDNVSQLYYKDLNNDMDKFFGTWEYNDGTNYLKITFSKNEHVQSSRRSFYDRLVCEFQFKINGVEKYNTYGSNSTINEPGANGILGSSFLSDNKIKLTYFEPPLNGCARYQYGNLTLEFINNTPNQLIWTRTNAPIFGWKITCGDGSAKDMSEQIIPANLTLTKVN